MRILGMLGIAASLILAAALPFLPARLIPSATELALEVSEGLGDLSNSVAATSSSLISASEVLEAAATTIEKISETIKDTKPLLESSAAILEDVGENTLKQTNRALDTVQSAAQSVDRVLRGLAVFGAITGISYDPERSLEQAVADVATGLKSLPDGLIEVSGKIYDTAEGFDTVSGELDQTRGELQGLSDEVRDLGERLGTLSATLEKQAMALDQLVERLPTLIWASVVLMEFFLTGVLLAQATAVVVGGRLYRENTPVPSVA
ncbi:MAG: hypothetical protein J4N76_06740 [Chloroflexi bacterium]|nr:hypothetical protein [Chloroflexota bacterium]MCI0876246.1 hypothetical protein [Chloroflexota bacterium]